MQVAETLGIPVENSHPSIPDTDTIGFTQTTGGSRTTYATGYAGWESAKKLIEEIAEFAKVEVPPKGEGKQIVMILVPNVDK